MEYISRNDAFELLKKYNKDPFHIQHALTVEAVMKWYANELGYGDDAEYWGIVGTLSRAALYQSTRTFKRGRRIRGYNSWSSFSWLWNYS